MMKRRLIAMLLCIAMIGSMTVYAVGDDTTCTCNTQDDVHAADCALLAEPAPEAETEPETEPVVTEPETEPVVCTCNAENDEHTSECALYVAPETEPEVTEPEATEPEVTEPEVTEPEAEPTVAQQLLATTSLADFRAMLLAEENFGDVLALTAEEIEGLMAHVNALYAAIEVPTADDTDVRDEMLETLTYLPAMECPECGEFGSHADDCVRNIADLPADGLTINANLNISANTISGNNTVWTFTSDVTVTLTGTITIPNGKTLTINGPGTILRSTGNDMFLVKQGGTLIINNVVIDGNNRSASGAAIHLDVPNNNYPSRIGKLTLDNATIKNCNRTSGMGGAIKLGDDNSSTNTVECSITNTIIDNCDAPQGSAIMMHTNCQGNITLSNSTIRNCDATQSYAGTIRTQGGANCKLRIESCTITGNNSSNNGGGVYWNARGKDAHLTITGTENVPTIISNNTASNGGGIFLSGQSISIEHTEISGNTAVQGGGINMQPYDYSGSSSGVGCTLTLGAGAKVLNNRATEYGGGIYLKIDSGSTTDGEDFTITVNEGAAIQGNTAPYGGAFAVTQKTGNAEYSGGASRKYDAYVNIKGGIISGNTGFANGGAFYISREYGNAGANYDLEVDISDGQIFGNRADGNGGAIYLADDSGKAQVNVRGGEATTNTAVNGGAVYVSGGNFTMSGGSFVENTATANGGAVYVTGGNVSMTGGSMTTNNAVNGGAVYVTGGNFDMSGGAMESNTASTNGGAAYVTGGNFEMTGGTLGGSANTGNTALNGGAVYVNGGDFNMISGTMSFNKAIEKTAGAAENRTEGYGGGVYAAGGNIYIGVENCNGKGETHSNNHTDLPHPTVTENTGVFGGALAVNGGSVYIYCGEMVENHSDNDGTGMNVFMTGDNSALYHYLDNAQIGEDNDHGMVSVGGTLTIIHGDGEQFVIQIRYKPNYEGSEMDWAGQAPKHYYLNLPYCPQSWQDYQKENNKMTFVGWTQNEEGTTPEAIRSKENYLGIGQAVEMLDIIQDEDQTTGRIDFWAVWAPLENAITYAYSLDGVNIVTPDAGDLTNFNNAPDTYICSNVSSTLEIPTPIRTGYAFKGWKMYSKNDKISNWGMDASVEKSGWKYPPELIEQIQPGKDSNNNELYVDVPISLLTNFGDIVMVAIFEPQFADLTITKTGSNVLLDSKATYIYQITGTPEDAQLGQVNMTVMIPENNTITIVDLPVGTYTVTEMTDWSWRYDVKNITLTNADGDRNGDSVTFALMNPAVTVDVKYENTRVETKWLDGYWWKKC